MEITFKTLTAISVLSLTGAFLPKYCRGEGLIQKAGLFQIPYWKSVCVCKVCFFLSTIKTCYGFFC